jgi:hypothetical protein
LGSNPHSNGDLFFWSSLIFLEIKVVNTMMVVDRKMVTVAAVVTIIIIYLVFTNFSIGNQVYFILFFFLISRLRCIRIVKLRLRCVNNFMFRAL